MIDRNILVVEDDSKIRNFICYTLEQNNYIAKQAADAQTAMKIVVSEPIDLMVLDLGLPDFDGVEVIKKVREWSTLPIIVVSARDQINEKVEVLDLGADDYITKPFSAIELIARIKVALRHKEPSEKKDDLVFEVGDLRLDYERHFVYVKREEIHLTPMEFNLLALFVNNAGKVLTTTYIIHKVWGYLYDDDTQVLRTLMASLRRKIEKQPSKPKYIKTEIGIGYRLSID